MQTTKAMERFRCGAMVALCLGVLAGWSMPATARPDMAPASAATAPELAGSEWILYEVRDPAGKPMLPFAAQETRSRSIVVVEFEERMLSFAEGCGRYLAPYRQVGSEVVIGEFYRTVSSCNRESGEARFVQALVGITQARLGDGPTADKRALVLETGAGRSYFFYQGTTTPNRPRDAAAPATPEVAYRQYGSDTVPCAPDPRSAGLDTDEPPPQCLAVRAVRQSPQGKWEAQGSPWPMSRTLAGLYAEAGTRTVARIVIVPVENPDIHGPTAYEHLDMVIEQQRPSTDKATRRNPSHRWIP